MWSSENKSANKSVSAYFASMDFASQLILTFPFGERKAENCVEPSEIVLFFENIGSKGGGIRIRMVQKSYIIFLFTRVNDCRGIEG